MEKSVEVQAKTIDLAIEQACAQLGASYDEVDVEILSEGGFLRKPKVKVSIKTNEKSELKNETATEVKKEAKPEIIKEQAKETVKAAANEIPKQIKAENKVASKAVSREESKETKPVLTADGMPVKFRTALDFTTKLLELLGTDVTILTETTEKSFDINIDGENVGMIIGKGGEVMNAIQTVVGSVAIANSNGENRRVNINVKDYKERRLETLKALAIKKAEKVKATGKYVKLEAMSARDRAIIHSALQDVEGIRTYSTGKDPHRCLCIAPKRED